MKKSLVFFLLFDFFRADLNRDDSPWYPSVKLLDKNATCDWDSVLKDMRKDITKFFFFFFFFFFNEKFR